MLYEPEYGVGHYGAYDSHLLRAPVQQHAILAPVQLQQPVAAMAPAYYDYRPQAESTYGRVARYTRPPSPVQERRGPAEFSLLYMGSVPMVGQGGQGAESEPSMEDVARVVEYVMYRTDAYRREGTRLKTYFLRVGIDKIGFRNAGETRDVQHIPLNKIHFVAADPRNPRVFSLVARGGNNRFLCHVFECNNPRQCEVITRTVSESFRFAYEKWLRVEENQRRLEERRTREMDMGGIEYFQEWDQYAPPGMPLYNISGYYHSDSARPRQYLRPRDELPSLPERLIVSRNQHGAPARRDLEPEREPYSLRYNFDDDDEEVYVRQDRFTGRSGSARQQPMVFDVRPDWE